MDVQFWSSSSVDETKNGSTDAMNWSLRRMKFTIIALTKTITNFSDLWEDKWRTTMSDIEVLICKKNIFFDLSQLLK